MTELRRELALVVEALARASEDTREVSLDAIGEAIGVMAVSHDEIDAMLLALEARGLRVTGPEGGGGEARLGAVLRATRALMGELGRRPSVPEIAARAELSEGEVRHALALARVMQR